MMPDEVSDVELEEDARLDEDVTDEYEPEAYSEGFEEYNEPEWED